MHNFDSIKSLFEQRFGSTPTYEIRACGRINIIGEHTDYNMGYVLPAAIDKFIFFAGALNGLDHCRVYAADIDEYDTIPLTGIFQKSSRLWINYLTGILDQYRQQGVNLGGLDVVFGGNLPLGSGMSSSAALETGFATLVKTAFEFEITKPDIARLAQRSSHQFVGVPCGIMDQFASLMGREKQLVLLDCRSLEYEYIPCDLGQYEIVLINSKVSHDLSESAYEARVEECAEGVKILQQFYPAIQSLRDASKEQVLKHADDLGPTVFKRCLYVTSENERLLKVCEALREGQAEDVGPLLFETHAGLRDLYEVSCKEVDFLVDFAEQHPAVIGSRIMGGGFGGCSINLVDRSQSEAFIAAVKKAYQQAFDKEAEAYQVDIVDGTDLVKSIIYS
ncbi:MAG: galactokinase [Saprospiraceae bacterium]|nr:galactokinase [Saprospiraceae bacterium]